MIQLIGLLVASPKVSTKPKRFILDELTGQIVGRHSLNITERRCHVTEIKHHLDNTQYGTVLADFIHQLERNDVEISERLLLHRAVKRARRNGWDGGEWTLEVLSQGRPFDAGYVLRGFLAFDDFLAAFWQGENLAKHRLGLTLFEDPLTYVRIYVRVSTLHGNEKVPLCKTPGQRQKRR